MQRKIEIQKNARKNQIKSYVYYYVDYVYYYVDYVMYIII